MVKVLGIMLGGIFVGAVGIEIIRRKYPNALDLDNVRTKTRKIASGAKEGFIRGYRSALRPAEVAAPSAG